VSAASFAAALATGALREVQTTTAAHRYVMRDDSLPHQIRLNLNGNNGISVSCTCRATGAVGGGTCHYEPLETRSRWESHEPIQVWRKHMEAVQP
jgi:hypothetical protein